MEILVMVCLINFSYLIYYEFFYKKLNFIILTILLGKARNDELKINNIKKVFNIFCMIVV